MRQLLTTVLALAVALGSHATEDRYVAFLDAFSRNDVNGLMALSEAGRRGLEAERPLAFLALAGARLRSEDMRGCLDALDSLDVSQEEPDRRITAMACQLRAQVLDWAGEYAEGLKQIDKGLKFADSTSAPRERATLLIIGAELFLSQGDLAGAAQNLIVAERLAHRTGFDRASAMIAINRGTIRFHQQRYAEAAADFTETARLAAANNWPVLLENASFNIASVHIMLGNPEAALDIFQSVRQRDGTPPALQAQLLSHIGRVHHDRRRFNDAITAFNRSIAISDSLHDRRETLKTLQLLAYAEWEQDRHAQAIARLDGLLDEARALGMGTTLAELHWQLHRWKKHSGDVAMALMHMTDYAAMKDSLSKLGFNKQLARLEVASNTERKERRIAEQEQALALAAAEDRRKNIQRIALGISALAVTVIALLLARSLRNRRRLAEQERKLHAQQVDELLKRSEIEALNAMMEGQEKERDRVARDLHDRLGSMLSAIKHQIDGLDADVQGLQVEQRGHYTKVNRMLDEAVGEVRRISHDMVSVTLARFGLEKALEDLCDSVRLNGRLAVELSLFGMEQRMERGLEITVYRMVQELVSNVLKHADAHELSIGVTRGPGRISVIVADDGRGFDTSAAADGIGLSNVRARAAAMGAQVTVNSATGKGTTVSIEGPVVE